MLSERDLENLARKVKDAGIRRVTGNLVVDDTFFDAGRLGSGWSWDYLGALGDYAAQIGALNCNENRLDVFVLPGAKTGVAAIVKTVPATDYITIYNAATTGKPGSAKKLFVDRELGRKCGPGGEGIIPCDSKVTGPEESVSVDDPALYAGRIFRDSLSRLGVQVTGGVKRAALPSTAKCLGAHASPPLSEICALLNKPSDNLIAEVLLKTLGTQKGAIGTTAGGIQAEREFLKEVGLDMDALSIVDGSGLSRLNFISPPQSRHYIELHALHINTGGAFIASLPVAAADGTLRGPERKLIPAEPKSKDRLTKNARAASSELRKH